MEAVLSDLVSYVSKYITVEHATYIIYAVFIPSFVTKLFAPNRYGAWPSLPSWFWLATGVLELVATVTFYQKKYDVAIPMFFTYFGIILACIINPQTIGFFPFPTFMVVIVSYVSKAKGFRYFPTLLPGLGVGFGAAAVVHFLFNKIRNQNNNKNN